MEIRIKPEDLGTTDVTGFAEVYAVAPDNKVWPNLIFTEPLVSPMYDRHTEARVLSLNTLLIEVDDPTDPMTKQQLLQQYLAARAR